MLGKCSAPEPRLQPASVHYSKKTEATIRRKQTKKIPLCFWQGPPQEPEEVSYTLSQTSSVGRAGQAFAQLWGQRNFLERGDRTEQEGL